MIFIILATVIVMNMAEAAGRALNGKNVMLESILPKGLTPPSHPNPPGYTPHPHDDKNDLTDASTIGQKDFAGYSSHEAHPHSSYYKHTNDDVPHQARI